MEEITLLYQDEYIVAANKPAGLPVHKNSHMPRDQDYLLKRVGLMTGLTIYPVHRLDAKTSGIVLMAFDTASASVIGRQFEERLVEKGYLAFVKGNPGAGNFDSPVLDRKKKRRVDALTGYRTLASYPTSLEYKDILKPEISLVELWPRTGRWHQLRQHLSALHFDIIGDTQHGDWTLNKIITERTGFRRLMLHARSLQFSHPQTAEKLLLEVAAPEIFSRLEEILENGL